MMRTNLDIEDECNLSEDKGFAIIVSEESVVEPSPVSDFPQMENTSMNPFVITVSRGWNGANEPPRICHL